MSSLPVLCITVLMGPVSNGFVSQVVRFKSKLFVYSCIVLDLAKRGLSYI